MSKQKLNYMIIGVISIIFVLALIVMQQNYKSKSEDFKTEMENEVTRILSEKNTLEEQLQEKEDALITKEDELNKKEEQIRKSENFFDTYIKAYNHLVLASSDGAGGDYFYATSSAAYDINDYQSTIDLCVEARSYFFAASQDYNNAEALFKKAKDYAPKGYWGNIVEKYILLTDSGSKLHTHMYEACEYFESAAFQYLQWSTYGDEGYWLSGNEYLNEMGRKINAHDSEVLRFNKYLAETNAILETVE